MRHAELQIKATRQTTGGNLKSRRVAQRTTVAQSGIGKARDGRGCLELQIGPMNVSTPVSECRTDEPSKGHGYE